VGVESDSQQQGEFLMLVARRPHVEHVTVDILEAAFARGNVLEELLVGADVTHPA
jgi:hypothetical protein